MKITESYFKLTNRIYVADSEESELEAVQKYIDDLNYIKKPTWIARMLSRFTHYWGCRK